MPSQLQRVVVIGSGIIGHGVAQVSAVAGFSVCMIGRRRRPRGPSSSSTIAGGMPLRRPMEPA